MDRTNANQTSVGPWKTAAIGFAVLTVLAAGWGLMEFQQAQRFAELLGKERRQSASLQTSLAEAAKPDLPLMISFRPAILGNGLVAVFRNTSSTQLEVAAAFSSEATGIRRGASMVIPANAVTEIGYAQGWAFAAGQRIRLTNGEFRPAEYQVPGS
jgi:hypothetical protein